MDASKILAGTRDALKAAGVHIHPASAEDFIMVSKDLRDSEKAHARLFGEIPRTAVMKAYLASDLSWAIKSDDTGELLGVLCVSGDPPYIVGELAGRAAGLIGRPALETHLAKIPARAVVKAFRSVAKRLLIHYGPLMGFLPMDNHKLLRFLTIVGAMPFAYEGRAFGWHLKLET